MDIGIILSIVSLIFPLVAAVINAKGPKKYKSIYINFLFFSIGLSLGIITIFFSYKIGSNINSEQVSIYISEYRDNLSTKITKTNIDIYEAVLPISYSCTITNLGDKPVTFVDYDILLEQLGQDQSYAMPGGFFEGDTKITKPFTLGPSESKSLSIIIVIPLDTKTFKIISDSYDINKHIKIYDLMERLAENNLDIYGRSIEFAKPYRFLNDALEKKPSYYVILKTARQNRYLQGFGKYIMYPIE